MIYLLLAVALCVGVIVGLIVPRLAGRRCEALRGVNFIRYCDGKKFRVEHLARCELRSEHRGPHRHTVADYNDNAGEQMWWTDPEPSDASQVEDEKR